MSEGRLDTRERAKTEGSRAGRKKEVRTQEEGEPAMKASINGRLIS